MKCKICNNNSSYLFNKKVLTKYEAGYWQCNYCKFVFVHDPTWLSEAYSDAITKLDIGMLQRNIILHNRLSTILKKWFSPNSKYLDYAGGYGIFTRLMRDRGFNFYHFDEFCQNIFANFFTLKDSNVLKPALFSATTAFEVFEHFSEPVSELAKILEYSSTIFFTTEIVQSTIFEKWWYLTPETGQHISFYSIDSLKYLGKLYNLNFATDGKNFHLFSKEKINLKFVKKPLQFSIYNKLINFSFNSKLQTDFIYIKDHLNKIQ